MFLGIAKCFALAGPRGTDFGSPNDRLAQNLPYECASLCFPKEREVKGAPYIVDEPRLELRECLAGPSSCDGQCRRMIKSD